MINSFDMDSHDAGRAFDLLHGLIFKLLLETDGRTTDMLETLLNEKMLVHVIRQEQIHEEHADLFGEDSGAPYYIRESLLISEKSHFLVSHNLALVHSKHVPPSLFEKMSQGQEGIGKLMSTMGLQTFRKVHDSGMKNGEEAVDLFQKPIQLRFPELRDKVPYKKYSIYFRAAPGIQLLEYFNPNVVRHRLNQSIGGMDMIDKATKEQMQAKKQLKQEEKARVKEQKRLEKQAPTGKKEVQSNEPEEE
jgi:chorismate-pyruvate lyase